MGIVLAAPNVTYSFLISAARETERNAQNGLMCVGVREDRKKFTPR